MKTIQKISIGGEVFDFSLPSSMAGKGLSVQEDGSVKLDLSLVALGTGVDVSGIVQNIPLGTGLAAFGGKLILAIGTGLNKSNHNCLTLDLSTSALGIQYNVNGVTENIKLGTGLLRDDSNAVLYIDTSYVKSLQSIASGEGITVTPHGGGTPIEGVTSLRLSTGIASQVLSGNEVAIRLGTDVIGAGLIWSNYKICVNTNFLLDTSVLGTGLTVSDDNKLTLSTKACGTGLMLSTQNQLMLSSLSVSTGCLYEEGAIYIDEAYVKSIFEKLINEMNA